MAVSGLWFEAGLNKEVWRFYKKCTCGGTLTYKYRNTLNSEKELWIYPNRRQFRIIQKGTKTITGTITEMIAKLNEG
jgi:hypothetical protein